MPTFDAYIFVDWSGANQRRTGKDSIWIAEGSRKGTDFDVKGAANPGTRGEATRQLVNRLAEHVKRNHRVLIGLDFPYGYPYGFASAIGLSGGSDWRAIWKYLAEHIEDQPDNSNERFEFAAKINRSLGEAAGPFYGRPWQHEIPDLPIGSTAVTFPYDVAGTKLNEYRQTEWCLKKRRIPPSPVWKLFYQPTVGSQALLGIPRLEYLRSREDLQACSRVWPFETDWAIPDMRPLILHAEIYPGVVPTDDSLHTTRDAAQVLTLLYHAKDLDDQGELAACFDRPKNLDQTTEQEVLRAEGWILWA